MATHHIFLVEDDAPLRVSLTRLLEISGYCVSGFETAEDLLGNLSKSNSEVRPHCIVLDVNLPGLSGVVLQERLRKMQIDCAVIFISAELNAHHVNSAWRDGASDFIFKPFQPEALLKAIAKALHKNSVDGFMRFILPANGSIITAATWLPCFVNTSFSAATSLYGNTKVCLTKSCGTPPDDGAF